MLFQTTHLDPFLDDCVMFAKKLKSLEHDVTLDLLEGLPHGFLSLSMVSIKSLRIIYQVLQYISMYTLFNLAELKGPPLPNMYTS